MVLLAGNPSVLCLLKRIRDSGASGKAQSAVNGCGSMIYGMGHSAWPGGNRTHPVNLRPGRDLLRQPL
jgi:hypothetical protein